MLGVSNEEYIIDLDFILLHDIHKTYLNIYTILK